MARCLRQEHHVQGCCLAQLLGLCNMVSQINYNHWMEKKYLNYMSLYV